MEALQKASSDQLRSTKEQEEVLSEMNNAFASSLAILKEKISEARSAERKYESLQNEIPKLEQKVQKLSEQAEKEQKDLRKAQEKQEKVAAETEAMVTRANEMLEKARIADEALSAWYTQLKFYARRLKKKLMARNIPFPEELTDLRYEKVFYKNHTKNHYGA